MRTIILLCFLISDFVSFSQIRELEPKAILNEGNDTVYQRTTIDTLIIPIKVKYAKHDVEYKIWLKYDDRSSDGIINYHFYPLASNQLKANPFDATNTSKNSGYFKLVTLENLSESLILYFFVEIKEENGKTYNLTRKLVVAPKRKVVEEKKEQDKKEPGKKETTEFVIYNDEDVFVYKCKNAVEDTLKSAVDLRIKNLKIDKKDKTKYYIEIPTTTNEVYYSTISLSDDMHFLTDDRLYLNGIPSEKYLHAKDIFFIKHDDGKGTVKNPAGRSIKF